VELTSTTTTTGAPTTPSLARTRPHCHVVVPADDYRDQGQGRGQSKGDGRGRQWPTVAAESYAGGGRRRVMCFRNTTSEERRQRVLKEKGLWIDDMEYDDEDNEYDDYGNTGYICIARVDFA